MNSYIKTVFSIIAVLIVSMVLWYLIFGAAGRTFMWNAIEPAMQNHWSECTMQDGKVLSDTFAQVFDNAPEYSVTTK